MLIHHMCTPRKKEYKTVSCFCHGQGFGKWLATVLRLGTDALPVSASSPVELRGGLYSTRKEKRGREENLSTRYEVVTPIHVLYISDHQYYSVCYPELDSPQSDSMM